MFSLDHVIWIVISALIITGLSFLDRKFNFKIATYVIAGVSVLSELTKIMTHVFPASRYFGEGAKVGGYEGASYLLPKSLPFHLCSILIFFIFFLALSSNEKHKEMIKTFIVPICILGGFLGIVMATSLDGDNTAHLFDSFKDPSLSPYQSFIYHACIFWYGVYLMKTKQVKLGFKEWLMDGAGLFALFIVSIWINSALLDYKVNFMFTAYPPAKGLPLLNLDNGWHAYIIALFMVGLVATFLLHLPYMIIEWKKGKKKEEIPAAE